MQTFAACVADHSAAKAGRTLSSDFRSNQYRSAMNAMLNNNADCNSLLPRNSVIRSSRLLFAGALAERLMTKGSDPLNVRLAKAAALPAAATYSPSDAIAMCTVRSAPDDTAQLFGSAAGSDAEAEAIRSLQMAVRLCSRGTGPFAANPEGLRAILATAAFRSVAALDSGKK